jgi:hypothetical protein
MLVLVAFVAFLLAFVFKVFGGPAEAWLQPQALLYLGLAAWVLAGLVPWAPWPRRRD